MKVGPSGSAIRSLIPSHRGPLCSKATVVSAAESALPTLLLTIKRYPHILRHETSLADSTKGRKKSAMRPNGNDKLFLASYFEFVDCNFIKEPRPKRSQGSRTRFLANPFEQLPNDSHATTHRQQHCRFLLSIDTWRLKGALGAGRTSPSSFTHTHSRCHQRVRRNATRSCFSSSVNFVPSTKL